MRLVEKPKPCSKAGGCKYDERGDKHQQPEKHNKASRGFLHGRVNCGMGGNGVVDFGVDVVNHSDRLGVICDVG